MSLNWKYKDKPWMDCVRTIDYQPISLPCWWRFCTNQLSQIGKVGGLWTYRGLNPLSQGVIYNWFIFPPLRGMNFAPRKPSTPLQIKNPTTGEAVPPKKLVWCGSLILEWVEKYPHDMVEKYPHDINIPVSWCCCLLNYVLTNHQIWGRNMEISIFSGYVIRDTTW